MDIEKKDNYINIQDFQKINLKLGKILSAEKVPDADKLLKLSVDLGPSVVLASEGEEGKRDIRQIVSGIAPYFPDPSALVGKKYIFVANLEPRNIRGLVSEGMILALSTFDEKFSLITSEKDIQEGAQAK